MAEEARSDALFHADADLLFDSLLRDVRNRIGQLELDVILLPHTETDFSKKALGIVWKGTLILTNGSFTGLGTLHRIGGSRLSISKSAVLNFQSLELTFDVDLGITKPKITYGFQLLCENRLIANREISGVSTGTISTVTFNIVLSVNIFTRKVRVVRFRFLEVGKIDTEISGIGTIFDFLASKAVTAAANRIKQDMAHEAETQIEVVLRDVFEKTPWPVMTEIPNILMQYTGTLFRTL